MTADHVFKALADPTRPHLLDGLFKRERQTLGELGHSGWLTAVFARVANEELYGGSPMVLSGLNTLLETGESLTKPASLMYMVQEQVGS